MLRFLTADNPSGGKNPEKNVQSEEIFAAGAEAQVFSEVTKPFTASACFCSGFGCFSICARTGPEPGPENQDRTDQKNQDQQNRREPAAAKSVFLRRFPVFAFLVFLVQFSPVFLRRCVGSPVFASPFRRSFPPFLALLFCGLDADPWRVSELRVKLLLLLFSQPQHPEAL
ncbi:hypothetical protein WMY93_022424 [Mugilogobius chulae]|uniref:Transmembrane protein n=1 Tax=Mugilogobius chulae TaxID=88201 RepID=A0AAW0NBE5_9GOBI